MIEKAMKLGKHYVLKGHDNRLKIVIYGRFWKNYAKFVYEQEYGKLPKGWVVHHKIPIEFGGIEDIVNYVAMPKKLHTELHKVLPKSLKTWQKFAEEKRIPIRKIPLRN